MKKAIPFLFFFFQVNSFSQGWFEGTPEWNYDYDCNVTGLIINGWEAYRLEKDTLLDGNICKQVIEAYHKYYVFEGFTNAGEKSYYLYEKNDSVFRVNENGTKDLIYDFTLPEGHVRSILWGGSSQVGDSDTLLIELDYYSIYGVNGIGLKVQIWKLLNNLDCYYPSTIEVIEKIGVIGKYNFFFDDFHCSIDGCRPSKFKCYRNEALGIYYPNGNCESFTLDNDPHKPYIDVKIYPNPAHDFLRIEWSGKSKSEFSIVSIDGRLLQVGQLLPEKQFIELDVSEFSSGIYFLKISGESGAQVKRFVVSR